MIRTMFHDTFPKDALHANVANTTALNREGSANEVSDTLLIQPFHNKAY